MNIPCPTPPSVCDPCTDANDALICNASAETADVRKFFSYRYELRSSSFCEATTQLAADLCALSPPDPFVNDVVYSSAEQTCIIDCNGSPLSYTVPAGAALGLSQAIADAAAYSLACTGAAIVCAGGSGTLVSNEAQTCSVTCSDGSVVYYTIPAGSVQGFSLSEANASAYATACLAAAAQCPDIPPPLFGNVATSSTSDCPATGESLGGTFTFQVAANTFFASTQGEANAAAQSYADQQAVLQRSCLSSITLNTCLGSAYAEVITTTLPGSITWSITSGSLPPGISHTDGVLSGTSLAAGSYSFTIQALSSNGNSTSRTYTVCVTQIANASALPDAMPSVAYTATFTLSPFCGDSGTVTWNVSSGSLPPGLSLNKNTGVLSGTPTTIGNYSFTISNSLSCPKAFTLDVMLDPLEWWKLDEAGNTSRVGSINSISLASDSSVGSTPGGKYGNATTLNSNGPPANIDCEISNISTPVTGLAYAGNGVDAFFWVHIPAVPSSDTTLLINFADSAGTTVWAMRFVVDNLVGVEYDMTGGASGNVALATSPDYRLFELYYDPSLTRLGLRVNDGAVLDQWITVGPVPPATVKGALSINYDRKSAGSSAAEICELAVYPSILNATQRAYLYQGGLGRTWPNSLP